MEKGSIIGHEVLTPYGWGYVIGVSSYNNISIALDWGVDSKKSTSIVFCHTSILLYVSKWAVGDVVLTQYCPGLIL